MNHLQANLFPDLSDQPSEDQLSIASSSEERALSSKADAAKNYVSSIWSFPGSGGDQLYRWYGTLPRALVERLFSLYAADKRARVLDAFTGLGTTLDVAADADLTALGTDVNPLACLATAARLYGIPADGFVLKLADAICKKLAPLIPDRCDAERWSATVDGTRYDYTRKWFRPDSLSALLALHFEIASVEDVRTQRLMFVAASQVVRGVASVDPRCTHHLVTKQKPFVNPLPLWRQHVSEIVGAVRIRPALPTRVRVKQSSILDLDLKSSSIDFALLHPPYLGVIHYHLIHRLATDILDIVKSATDAVSLAEYDFGYTEIREADASTDRTERFQEFVERLSHVMQRVVAADGRCIVIIGDQRHKGHLRHPFTDFIKHFENNGFQLEENFIWVLQNNGGMHILRRGHFIDHNYILVFRKEGETKKGKAL